MQSSTRSSYSSLFDVKQTLLLVPTNETIGSLLTLNSQTMPVSADEIKQAICETPENGNSHIKRSVTRLQESGAVPEHGDAITKCPLNSDQICLNLKDDAPPSESTPNFHPTIHF